VGEVFPPPPRKGPEINQFSPKNPCLTPVPHLRGACQRIRSRKNRLPVFLRDPFGHCRPNHVWSPATPRPGARMSPMEAPIAHAPMIAESFPTPPLHGNCLIYPGDFFFVTLWKGPAPLTRDTRKARSAIRFSRQFLRPIQKRFRVPPLSRGCIRTIVGDFRSGAYSIAGLRRALGKIWSTNHSAIHNRCAEATLFGCDKTLGLSNRKSFFG